MPQSQCPGRMHKLKVPKSPVLEERRIGIQASAHDMAVECLIVPIEEHWGVMNMGSIGTATF